MCATGKAGLVRTPAQHARALSAQCLLNVLESIVNAGMPTAESEITRRNRGAGCLIRLRSLSAPRYALVLSATVLCVGLVGAELFYALGTRIELLSASVPWIMFVALLQVSARWRGGSSWSEACALTVALALSDMVLVVLREVFTESGSADAMLWGRFLGALILFVSFGIPVNAFLIWVLRIANRAIDHKLRPGRVSRRNGQ